MSTSPLVLLHDTDNVFVCRREVRPGETLDIDGAAVMANEEIGVGHKVARRDLAAGEKVLKYGAPIGSMTAPAPKGAHVHMHNLKSDYISTHTRAGGDH
jgi:hypothetical protein